MSGPEPYDAVVLTGGRGRRLGGVDKPGLTVGGRTLGARVVAAVAGADRVIVVGPVPAGARVDVATREEPPGGGPVAALAAGLAAVTAPTVATFAGDLPFLTPAAVDALRSDLAAASAAAAALFTDADGRDQLLAAVWRSEPLRAALAEIAAVRGDLAGTALRAVHTSAGTMIRRTVCDDGGPPPWFDCDTESDLVTARRWAGTRGMR